MHETAVAAIEALCSNVPTVDTCTGSSAPSDSVSSRFRVATLYVILFMAADAEEMVNGKSCDRSRC